MKLKISVTTALLWFSAITTPALAQELLIEPNNPSVGNCIPFGRSTSIIAGFVYQNIPGFSLGVGDGFAFDLGVMNDTDIQYDIYFSAATVNGGDTPAGWVKVASNSQIPANPRGDTTIGNYELAWTSESTFEFAGGGFMVRFDNPGGAFSSDSNCEQVLVHGNSSDSSGLFVKRFYGDSDGFPPWDSEGDGSIGAMALGVEVIPFNLTPVPAMDRTGLTILILLLGSIGLLVSLRRRPEIN